MTSKHSEPRPVRFLTRQQQAARYNKSVRAIVRWGEDPRMAMPPEYDFNGLKARREDELEAWERSRIGRRDSVQARSAAIAREKRAAAHQS